MSDISVLTSDHHKVLKAALGDTAAQLLSFCSIIQIPEGAELLTEGERYSTLYLLLDGQLEACRGSAEAQVRLGLVQPGQWLGEVSVIDWLSSNVSITCGSNGDMTALFSMVLDFNCRQSRTNAADPASVIQQLFFDEGGVTGNFVIGRMHADVRTHKGA